MSRIVVTGANGQLGSCFREESKSIKNMSFTFLTSKELNITNESDIKNVFKSKKFDFCINCAAYTAVDKAEEEIEKAYNINVVGVKYLSKACKENKINLIHISTDFVFNGNSKNPYKENDDTSPISVYGETKLKGEQEIMSNMNNYFIIRTSWLYSEYGNNFVKTMLKLSQQHKKLNVVDDQIGTPTYAKDLAKTIFHLIDTSHTPYGIYHYSNEGSVSWFDFAKAIFEESEINIKVEPIKSEQYPTLAKRPKYSVLNTSKIREKLKAEIPNWRDSLIECLSKITKN